MFNFDTKYEMQLHSFSIYSSIQSQNVRRECLDQQTFITKLCNWIRLLFSVFYMYVCPFRPAMDYPKNVRRLNVCRPKLCFFFVSLFSLAVFDRLPVMATNLCDSSFLFRKDTGNRICVEILYKNGVKYFRALVSVAKVIGVRY